MNLPPMDENCTGLAQIVGQVYGSNGDVWSSCCGPSLTIWTNPVDFRLMADLDGEADEVGRDSRPALQRPDCDLGVGVKSF